MNGFHLSTVPFMSRSARLFDQKIVNGLQVPCFYDIQELNSLVLRCLMGIGPYFDIYTLKLKLHCKQVRSLNCGLYFFRRPP